MPASISLTAKLPIAGASHRVLCHIATAMSAAVLALLTANAVGTSARIWVLLAIAIGLQVAVPLAHSRRGIPGQAIFSVGAAALAASLIHVGFDFGGCIVAALSFTAAVTQHHARAADSVAHMLIGLMIVGTGLGFGTMIAGQSLLLASDFFDTVVLACVVGLCGGFVASIDVSLASDGGADRR